MSMTEYKIVMLGNGGVGKSSTVIQFIQNVFVDEYDPTIEDSYRKACVIDDETCLLDILDTAGSDEFSYFRDAYMRTGEGFVFVYDITSRTSFIEIEQFFEQVLRAKDTDYIPCVLIGNKCDREDDREVSREEGEALCAQLGGFCEFLETSALQRVNIDEVFHQVVRQIHLCRGVNMVVIKNRFLRWKKSCYIQRLPTPPAPKITIPTEAPLLRLMENALHSDDTFKDLAIKCKNMNGIEETIIAHRFIMATRYPELVESARMNGERWEVVVDDVNVTAEAMKKLVEWTYRGKNMDLTYADAKITGLKAIAERFGDKELSSHCKALLKHGDGYQQIRDGLLTEAKKFDRERHAERFFEYREPRFLHPDEAEKLIDKMRAPAPQRPIVHTQESVDEINLVSPDGSDSVLKRVWNQMEYCDVGLSLESDTSTSAKAKSKSKNKNNSVIQVHRAVLAVASPHFRALLNPEYKWSESGSDENITIPFTTSKLLHCLIEFCYTADISVATPETAFGLLWLSDIYQIDQTHGRLKAATEKVLSENCDNSTRAHLLSTAMELHCPSLERSMAHQYIYDWDSKWIKKTSSEVEFSELISKEAGVPPSQINSQVTADIYKRSRSYSDQIEGHIKRVRTALGARDVQVKIRPEFEPNLKWYETSKVKEYRYDYYSSRHKRRWYYLWLK